MRSAKMNYVLVGCFALAMLVAAVAALAVVSGRTGPTDRYFVVMNNVADLKFGTQVRFEGFPVGQVEEITPFEHEGRMRFRIELSVVRDWQIPQDSMARITAPNLLASKTLDIHAGASADVLAPRSEIASAAPSDMFATMRSMAGELSTLNQDGLKPLIADLRLTISHVNDILVGDVANAAASVSGIAGSFNEASPDIAGNLQQLTLRLNQSAAAIEDLLSPANQELIQQVLYNVELGSLNFAALSTDLQTAAAELQAITQTVNGLVDANAEAVGEGLADARHALRAVSQNIDGVLHNMQGTARNMNEFSRLIRQNPGLLLNGRPRADIETASGVDAP